VSRYTSVIHLLMAVLLCSSPAAAQTGQDSPDTTAAAEPQGPDLVPEPTETNWGSLIKDTGRDFASFPRRRSTWVLLGAGGLATLAVHPADDYVQSHIVGNTAANRFFSPGKVLGSAGFQVGTALTLYFVGRHLTKGEERTHRLTHIGFDLMRTQIVAQSLVHGIKYSVRRDRPTGECCAFPSGHATSAFAAASVLERHFGYRGSWPALAAASYVATSRLVDNRHFLSDVVFGAAVGTAAGRTVTIGHGAKKVTMAPTTVPGGAALTFTLVER